MDYVAKLARIKLTPEEEAKFPKDLNGILEHFKELQELNTEKVLPLTGGTDLKNALRQDGEKIREADGSKLQKSFPDEEKGLLKVPPVFE